MKQNKNILIIDHSSSIHDYNQELFSILARKPFINFFAVSRLGIASFKNYNLKFGNIFFFIAQILKISKKNKITIVHWQWVPMFLVGLLLNFFFRSMRIKIVYTVHNTTPFHNQSSLLFKIRSFGFEAFLKSCDDLIVHNQYSQNTLSKISLSSKVIPHGPLSFGPIDSDEIYRQREKSRNLLFFGKLEDYKGLDRFCEVVPVILCNYPNIRITIAGAPGGIQKELFLKLESFSKNFSNFEFMPHFIRKEEAHVLFSTSRALILPYKHIDDSGVVNAAVNYELPCVISNIEGFFAKGLTAENSFVLDSFDESTWLSVLGNIFLDEVYVGKLAGLRALKAKVSSWPEIAEETIEVYAN